MKPLADQLDAAFRAAEGYSSMASSFHPELRERVAALVGQPRQFPPVELYTEQLPAELSPILHELAVRAATDSPATYMVWARYPEINWPIPNGYSPELITRWLTQRYGDRCNWCSRVEPTEALLASAGCAIAMFSVCTFCRIAFDAECTADQFWL